MAMEAINPGVHTHSRHKKSKKPKPNNADLDAETVSPRDEMKTQTKSAFDEYLKDALSKSQDIESKSKKKKKRVNEQVLESLRKGDGLRKEKDSLLDANTFDPEDNKKGKSNKKRQKERDKGGSDNPAFDKDEIIQTGKVKKKSQKSPDETITDKDMSISELATTKEEKKKTKKKRSEVVEKEVEPEREMEELLPPPRSTEKRKKKKKKTVESDLQEYQQHLENQEEDLSEVNTSLNNKLSQEQETLLSHEDETIVKTPQKKKKKKKQKPVVAEAAGDQLEDEPQQKETLDDDGRIVGITIHRTDKLKTDFWMAHPLVRITVIDLNTGHYLKKQHKDRAVVSFFENENENVDFFLPIMTQPYDFKQNKSTLPLWEEMVILNENFNYCAHPMTNVMVFFELLDFVTMNAASHQYSILKSEGGWHKIAWAFLKLAGANGTSNIDKKVRLQLYQPPTRYKSKGGSIDVYQWWKSNLRAAYPSTLYVTVKGIRPPDRVEPSKRSMFSIQQEVGGVSYDELEKSTERSGIFSARGDESVRKQPGLWSRLAGQAYKIPNCLSVSLPTGRNGCFAIKFSHDGKCLACACHDKQGYTIYLYEIPEGKLRGCIQAHFSLIYDLCWSRGNTHIVSASADGTARVWDAVKVSNTAVKTLPHPAFVYAAKFHPRVNKIIATAGYDCIVRVWTMEGDGLHGEMLLELDGHTSFVNAVCFDNEGLHLYSGDNQGIIYIWNVFVSEKPSSNGLLKEWTQNKRIEDAELEGVCISNLKVHPNGRRLLVHCRDNSIRMIDLRVGAVMQRYIGALNFREHIRSTISPCGTFVASGSEDCCAYIWNTETGDQVAMYSELGYKSTVCDVDFHTQDHMIAFCSFSDNSPVMIYKYDHQVAQRDVGFNVDVQKKNRSPSLKPGFDLKSDDEGLDESHTHLQAVTEDLRVHEIGRMDRVKRKLQSLSFQSMTPDLPSAVPRSGSVALSGGMSSSFTMGSTYDATGLYTPGRAKSPEPAVFSPHSHHVSTAAMEQQQHFTSQSQYMNQSPHSWRPGFSEISRSGRRSIGDSSYIGRPPQLSLTATQLGKPQFSFQGKSYKSEVVVALYDYQAQRSDELSFLRGDVITVLYRDNEAWWMGELQDGQQGFFPSNYVAGYENEEQADVLPEYVPKSNQEEEKDPKPKVTAVKMKSGELKFLSGTEDSDLEASARGKRSSRKSLGKVNFENEEVAMVNLRRKHKQQKTAESTA